MNTLVVSAVNLVDGGTVKVLQDFVSASRAKLGGWRIVVIVNNKNIIDTDGVETICMPDVKKSYINRIYTEYFGFKKISKLLKPSIWISLHDMSPIVSCGSQYVYCHHADPFYKFSIEEIKNEPKLLLFSSVYSWFYKANIHSNKAVIVQQEWMRKEFKKRYGVKNVIVAHPVDVVVEKVRLTDKPIRTFVYPALPRAFKNFEQIGNAVRILENNPDWKGRVLWTISPNESSFTRRLYKEYGYLKSIEFIGRQSRSAMDKLYDDMDCLLFPSRLETWGLPISEAKSLGKPMIVANLSYAHETVGNYDGVRFVDPTDPQRLADTMMTAYHHGWMTETVRPDPVAAPFAASWPDLIDTIVQLHEQSSGYVAT